MADSILNFTAKIDEAARSSLWKANITFPSFVAEGAAASAAVPYLVFQGSIPASTLSEVEVSFRGRKIYEAGEREYDDWECQVYNDVGFTVRKAFESWSAQIREPETHGGMGVPSNYKSTIIISQLDRNGSEVRRYKLHGAWIKSVQNIDLSYENAEIEKYGCTIRYDYFTIDNV